MNQYNNLINNYYILCISWCDNFEYRLCTDKTVNVDIRPYFIIKHIYDTEIDYHIDSLMSPISERLAIKLFYNRYNNSDVLKELNLSHIL